MRTIITIHDKEAQALDDLCSRRNWSRAKGVREGVRLLLQKHSSSDNRDVFGMWKDRQIDGVEYQQQLRSEW